MKISVKQLQTLIQEVAQSADSNLIESAVNDISERITENWLELYDESDPTMSEYGYDAWFEQVSEASSQLTQLLIEAVEKIQTRLLNGEYF